ncbi:hypothetical protein A3860_33070 [Niastella vici]|uniref:Uncharacterized protein n=1 Tax=Niastella vici TaxID=1703345 RepID=A0A1V9FQ89_9BACT|nr:hypothetical protein A3860_33070 [Niastella vici]
MVKRKSKFAILFAFALIGFVGLSSFVDEGESSAPSACLEVSGTVQNDKISIDDLRCYKTKTGQDEYMGMTTKCLSSFGNTCNQVTCSKTGCYTTN